MAATKVVATDDALAVFGITATAEGVAAGGAVATDEGVAAAGAAAVPADDDSDAGGAADSGSGGGDQAQASEQHGLRAVSRSERIRPANGSCWTRFEVDLHPADGAVELVAAGRAVVGHQGPAVGPDVEGLGERDEVRDGTLGPSGTDLGAVDEQDEIGALARSAYWCVSAPTKP